MLILALAGCEGDGLLSGDALAELSDIPPLPSEPAWAVRWHAGDEGLLADCDLIEVGEYEPDLVQGRVYAESPDITDAPIWLEGGGGSYRWALALLVLVNPEMYDPGASEEELLAELGVWGAVDSQALMLGEGDTEALIEDLRLEGDETGDLTDGGRWVGMLPELALARESLPAALYPLSEADWEEQGEEGLRVLSVEWLSDAAQQVLSGEELGGLTSECDQ
ncbi:MAG: hypothetical protein ACI8RZ_004102 [Myxococcota bacterium]|jgi:hypothetical protein